MIIRQQPTRWMEMITRPSHDQDRAERPRRAIERLFRQAGGQLAGRCRAAAAGREITEPARLTPDIARKASHIGAAQPRRASVTAVSPPGTVTVSSRGSHQRPRRPAGRSTNRSTINLTLRK
jgi:hypothetical protein